MRKRLFAQVALVRPDARVCARVTLQVEGVVEALSAESAQVPFDVRVALHVPVEQALQIESLGAHAADKLIRVVLSDGRRCHNFGPLLLATHPMAVRVLDGQGVLDPVAAVHKLKLDLGGQTQLKKE